MESQIVQVVVEDIDSSTGRDVVAGHGLIVIPADDQSAGVQHLQIIHNALVLYKSSAHRDDILATEHCSNLSPHQHPFVEISYRGIDRKSPTQLTVRSYS